MSSNHTHNLRSTKNKQVYNIELITSPKSSIASSITTTPDTPPTPRTPRILPKIPSQHTTPITIFKNIMDTDYIDRILILEKDLAEIRIANYNNSTENSILKDRIKDLEENKDEILNSLVSLETELDILNQYGRRENIELTGIPKNIPQENLEDLVIDILRFMGLHINSYDIAGCHRISKASVIVRFLNRKHAIESLQNKKHLNGCKRKFGYSIYIHENLCPSYKSIYEKCKNLMDDGDIKQLWTYNGVINCKYSNESSENPTKIYHYEDLQYYFPEKDERIFF